MTATLQRPGIFCVLEQWDLDFSVISCAFLTVQKKKKMECVWRSMALRVKEYNPCHFCIKRRTETLHSLPQNTHTHSQYHSRETHLYYGVSGFHKAKIYTKESNTVFILSPPNSCHLRTVHLRRILEWTYFCKEIKILYTVRVFSIYCMIILMMHSTYMVFVWF